MSGRSSQNKGAGGERELASILTDRGYQVKRGGSLSYGDKPDLYGLPGVHIEVKRTEKLNLHAAMKQAERDAQRFQDGAPTVFHRMNREPWLVTMHLTDWLEIYEKGDEHMTHWKKLTNPDFLGAYALEPGQEIAVTIETIKTEEVKNRDGTSSECIVAYFREREIKPMILNVTNCETIAKLAGSSFVEDWPGTRIQLYAAKVKAFGEIVEALRIRPTVPKDPEPVPPCEICGKQLTSAWKKTPAQLAEYTKANTGKVLCAACAKKWKEGGENDGEGNA